MIARPVIVPNEEFALYVNAEMEFSDFAESGQATTVGLLDSNFNLVTSSVGNFTAVQLEPGFVNPLNLYMSGIIDVTPGCYYLVSYSPANRKVYMISNAIEVMTMKEAKEKTVRLEYRANGNIYDFYYKKAPTFVNKVRVRCNPHNPQPGEDARGHDRIDDALLRTRRGEIETVTFATQWMDREDHRAFAAAIAHEALLIDGVPYRKNADSDYAPQWVEGGGMGRAYDYACAEVALDNLNYTRNNNYC